MRRSLFKHSQFVIILLLIVLGLIVLNRPRTSSFYDKMLYYHKSIDPLVPEGSLVFLGDSLVQGMCLLTFGEGAVNFGIAGDTVEGLLQRIDSYKSIKKAGAIFISVGINDLIQGKDKRSFFESYEKLIGYVSQYSTVYISALLPVDETIFRKVPNREIREINQKLKGLISKCDNVYFVDASKTLVDEEGNLDRNFHVGDGVHLSTEGYLRWIDYIKISMKIDTAQ